MAETTRRRHTTAADEPDEAPFVPRRKGPREEPTDRQVETTERLEPFEVLTEAPNGHRTVVRVRAADQAAARRRRSPTGSTTAVSSQPPRIHPSVPSGLTHGRGWRVGRASTRRWCRG
jgi:hypothetical protein